MSRSAEDCRRTIQEVIDLHGRLDILINNAGITIDKTVAKMTEDEWNKVIGGQPVRGVLPGPGRVGAHARARQRPDRHGLLGDR